MCNYLLHNFFLENAKTWVGRTTLNDRKRGIALRDKKNYATPTSGDLGQTSNWSKLVAAYLPVARLTILDRLVQLISSILKKSLLVYLQQDLEMSSRKDLLSGIIAMFSKCTNIYTSQVQLAITPLPLHINVIQITWFS